LECVGLLKGRPRVDNRLGTLGTVFPTDLISDEEMEWRGTSANGDG